MKFLVKFYYYENDVRIRESLGKKPNEKDGDIHQLFFYENE